MVVRHASKAALTSRGGSKSTTGGFQYGSLLRYSSKNSASSATLGYNLNRIIADFSDSGLAKCAMSERASTYRNNFAFNVAIVSLNGIGVVAIRFDSHWDNTAFERLLDDPFSRLSFLI